VVLKITNPASQFPKLRSSTSWNLGVELSTYNNICLCNDDLEFDPVLFELMMSNQDIMSDKIIGMHSENYHINSFNNTKRSAMTLHICKCQKSIDNESQNTCLLLRLRVLSE
jgi:hypothetical protein